MYRLLYRSRAMASFNEIKIDQMIKTAKVFNKENNISGMLLQVDRCFMQIIEGPKEQIEYLFYKKIFQDKRHWQVKVLLEGPIEKRSFESWSMELKSIENYGGLNKSENEILKEKCVNDPDLALEILKYFYKTGNDNLLDFWKSKAKD